MLTIITAVALAAAAQPASAAPAANPHAQHGQTRQMDHSRMGHSTMGEHADGCCTKTADGKMDCRMMNGHGAQHQGQSGQAHQGHGSAH